jgi:hypothetical protein
MQSFEYLTKWSRDLKGAEYLELYELSALCDDSVKDLWMRYGNTDSGVMSKDQIERMLKEVLEVTQGHRHVPPELLELCVSEMDPDGIGLFEQEAFEAAVKKLGIICSWSQDRSETLQQVVDKAFAMGSGELANIPYSLTVADPALPDCPLIGCSTGFTDLTGYPMHEIVGRSCRFLLEGVPENEIDIAMRTRSKDFVDKVRSHIKASSEGSSPSHSGQVLVVQNNARKDGERFTNLFLMREVWLEQSPFIFAVQVSVDPSDQVSYSSIADPDLLDVQETGSGPSVSDVQRKTVATLEKHMSVVENTLADLIPRLQRSKSSSATATA